MNLEVDCTLAISGPGSGKTFNMVKKSLNYINYLEPTRFMVLVTYTNAAAENIQERLHKIIRIQPNIFIGTIHSFMNRFILKPYAKLYLQFPSDYFIIDEFDFSFLNTKIFKFPLQRKITEKTIARNKFIDGVVCCDKLESVASELIDNNKLTIRKALSNRIQFLFVDEIQDATSTQYKIINNLRIEGKTKIFCIGDPEQYIYGFTYVQKGYPVKPYNKIPINKLKTHRKGVNIYIATEEENKRSSTKIIKFLNNFQNPPQKINQINYEEPDVIFIRDTNIKNIITKFNNLCEKLLSNNIRKDPNYFKFFLSYKNDTFYPVLSFFPMENISNENSKPKSLLSNALEYITAFFGRSLTELLNDSNFSRIEIRKIAISLLHKLKINPSIKKVDVEKYLINEVPVKIINHYQKTNNSYEKLCSNFRIKNVLLENKYTSIHKAKGLEAAAVLALAETKKRLMKWLETNENERTLDKQDECRIGFVGFSRAKNFLVLACLEDTDYTSLEKLRSLEVKIF